MHNKFRLIIISYILLLNICASEVCAEDVLYRVKRVIDGDTIELSDGARVRYIGIDTPEVRKKINGVWIYDPEPYGLEAKEYNRKMTEGKEVELEFDVEKIDKYNRVLAYVRIPGKGMINKMLLEEGLAEILFIPPNTKYLDEFNASENSARRAELGIWSEVSPE